MNTTKKTILALAAGTALGFAAGCVTYDFEPVEPLAIAKTTQKKTVVSQKVKPNLMLMVDKSGSMGAPINPSDSTCNNCGPSPGTGVVCPSNCKTRISELRLTMRGANGNDGFLTSPTSSQVARMGLAVFPNAPLSGTTVAEQCRAGTLISDIVQTEDVPAELTAAAGQINTFIQGLSESATKPEQKVVGGTPTTATLTIIGNQNSLNTPDRDDFILLLTDGLPNCNPNAPSATCTCPGYATGSCPSGYYCLDDDGSVAKIGELRGRGISTIVVGFGSDTAGGGAAGLLNNMAAAGGMPRNCLKLDGTRDPSLCGTESCDANNLCATKFYKATNAAELTAALLRISQIVTNDDPCKYRLESAPSKPELLTVSINGTDVASGSNTWTYDPGTNTVTFPQNGSICPQILAATPQKPVNVEFGIIESL